MIFASTFDRLGIMILDDNLHIVQGFCFYRLVLPLLLFSVFGTHSVSSDIFISLRRGSLYFVSIPLLVFIAWMLSCFDFLQEHLVMDVIHFDFLCFC